MLQKKRFRETENTDVEIIVENDHQQAENKSGTTSSGDTGQGGYGLTDSQPPVQKVEGQEREEP